MNVTWIGGWGVNPTFLKSLADGYLPGARHTFLPPTAEAVQLTAESDQVIAWSLGAWRVLHHAARGGSLAGSVRLLAPFLGFCAEDQLGGRIARAQVRWLRRWLERDATAALRDFHARAQLRADPSLLPDPAYPLPALLEGLDRLAEATSPVLRDFCAHGLPARWQAVVGGLDPLLDGPAICRTLPGCELVPAAGHAPAGLLAALEVSPDAL